ncbi:MAG: glycosyltransferase family 9 protein [Lentisphaerae bacterium]|nr:glycosyltransferase family 9 protein [Lentisphaerota bacterium]MCP4102703.1 glycosyltransferase family 9 protein [Lentisphaerota bacterium]
MLTAVAENAAECGKKISFYYLTSKQSKVQHKNLAKLELLKNNPVIKEVLIESRCKFWLRRLIRKITFRNNYIYFPLRRFSSAYMTPMKENKNRFKILNNGRHGITAFCDKAGIPATVLRPRVLLTDDEKSKTEAILKQHNLDKTPFIIIETGTLLKNSSKAWPLEYWKDLIPEIQKSYPEIKLIQISPGQQSFEGVIDISGKTSFRESLHFVEKAKATLTTEGALVHASAIFNIPSVVLVSRCMDPNLSIYPNQKQIFVDEGLDCINCGIFANCPNHNKCMTQITPEQVLKAINEIIH